MKRLLLILSFVILLGCSHQERGPGRGVSKELAEERFENISSLHYILHFSIPEQIDSSVVGSVEILFNLEKRDVVYLDFLHDSLSPVMSLMVNGEKAPPVIVDEHLVIESRFTKKGVNSISISFIAGEQSLNRRDEFLYTLLVPDRARTLFPCFDQPDLKAIFELSLDIPKEWVAMANATKIESRDGFVKFAKSEPLPTYLFSFVAGKFYEHKVSSESREITIFHRETLPHRIAQCDTIGAQIFSSLKWLEDYTGIPYPFSKYDIAIIPGFQYGGMEHAGATLYADRTLFTGEYPTTAERFARAKLIAHETAHMWFGDYVTMKWFDDVWTKEVFANWFAARMVSPLFPDIDHSLAFIDSYFPPAYAEERTAGTNPIQQNLDNLENAGLVYGNIIYNKAPIVMDMMVEMIGEEYFRAGIKEYLNKFAFSNATWDNLIEILDSYTSEDLRSWSNIWIKERGRPEVSLTKVGTDSLSISQSDPFKRGVEWNQKIRNEITEDGTILPNIDGKGYGLFVTDSLNMERIMNKLSQLPTLSRESALINLYENMMAGRLNPGRFSDALCSLINDETNKIIFSRAVSYLSSVNYHFLIGTDYSKRAADLLWNIASHHNISEFRITAFRSLLGFAWGAEWNILFSDILYNTQKYKALKLGERDFITLSYEYALREPLAFKEIEEQARRLINGKDRIAEFEFVYPFIIGDNVVRDSLFKTLLKSENRMVEPWAATALGYLCHFSRKESAVNYILPALQILPEIQKTGDIFFPANWLRALLSGQKGEQASEIIQNYLKNSNIHPLLRGKVLQQADHIINSKQR